MDSNFIFTTEGHILPLPSKYLKSTQAKPRRNGGVVSIQSVAPGTCQKYNPSGLKSISIPGLLDMSSIPYQPQTDYAMDIVGYTATELTPLSSNGYCESPITASKSFSLSFGYADYNGILNNKQRYKSNNLIDLVGGYLAKSLSGLRLEIISGGGGGRKNDGYIVKGG